MGTDNLQKRRNSERKRRVSKELETREETWLIICEGSKTEPNYFHSLFEYVNSLFSEKIKYRVEGEGRNTNSLVDSVDKYFVYYDKLVSKTNIPYGKVFVVFDKDDFKPEAFNSAIYKCDSKGYIPLWSNECIELWFLLHFEFLNSPISRQQYFEKLSKVINKKYQKNQKDFSFLEIEKNLVIAYRNSKKLYNYFSNEKSNANKKPCTTMFKLIDELNEYFQNNIIDAKKEN